MNVRKLFLVVTFILSFSIVVQAAMKKREKTTMIVVHHSGTDSGNVESFRRYHVDTNGWDDVGYHYVITNGNGGPDGEIQTGRDEELQGAHAANSGPNRNACSVGICLVGKDKFTDLQKEALITKLAELCIKYDIDPSAETIQPHHEQCPGDHLDLSDIILEVQAWMPAQE